MTPIKIILSPHDAIVLASFHNEFMPDMEGEEKLTALKTAMNNFFDAMVQAMPPDAMDDINAEIEVNILLGRSPERPK